MNGLRLRQRREIAELFGYESRNKYEICAPDGTVVLYAAEGGRSLGGMIMRQLLGHWRTFEIDVFDRTRNVVAKAVHPFRLFFQVLEVADASGRPIGRIAQRFGIFRKCFDVLAADGRVLMTVRSPFWRPWTFTFSRAGTPVAKVVKRWSGLLTELMTDADDFSIEFGDAGLTVDERTLLVAAGIFVDLQYFEQKAEREQRRER